MASLTATPDSTWAGVKLVVDLVSIPTATSVTVTRTNADGTQHIVRSGNFVPIPGGTTLVFDHEAPLGTSVSYSAQGYTYLAVAAGAAQTAAGVAVPTTTAQNAWIKSIDSPSLSRSLPVTVNGPWPRKRRTQRFDVIGRSNPIMHSLGLTGREGTLEVAAIGTTDIAAAEALFAMDRILLQWPPATLMRDMFCQFGDVEPVAVGPRAGNAQKWSTTVTEIDRPSTVGSVLLYPGVSYASPVFANYTAVAAAKTSYIDWADG